MAPALLLVGMVAVPGFHGCARKPAAGDPVPPEVSVLYWQLDPGSGASPAEVAATIRDLSPAIMVLELERGADEILDCIAAASPPWSGRECLPDGEASLALLTRFPILSTQHQDPVSYRMGGDMRRLRYGILDVTVQLPSGAPLHVMAVSAKDKTFDPAGQSEMRRNELRLVARHLEQRVRATPSAQLLLVGALNDEPEAAALRGLIGGHDPLLRDVRPLDASGDAWTSYEAGADRYLRHHYLLARTDLPLSSRVLNDPEVRAQSRHRPLWLSAAPAADR